MKIVSMNWRSTVQQSWTKTKHWRSLITSRPVSVISGSWISSRGLAMAGLRRYSLTKYTIKAPPSFSSRPLKMLSVEALPLLTGRIVMIGKETPKLLCLMSTLNSLPTITIKLFALSQVDSISATVFFYSEVISSMKLLLHTAIQVNQTITTSKEMCLLWQVRWAGSSAQS